MKEDNIMIRVNADCADRINDIISFSVKPKLHFKDWQEGTSQLAVSRMSESGEAISETPCQFDPNTRQLSWLIDNLEKRKSTLYRISLADTNEEAPKRYKIKQKPAHLLISVDDDLFTRYNYLGVWKPYFWPVNGPDGSVVRGAGGGDHPHHTGLFLAYGGHGEGGSANIWSDWDEPPYGPCGKMLHQRFVHLTEGPVYAEFVEDNIYVKGNGDLLLNERRTARIWYADSKTRFLDLSFETSPPMDIGDRQFLLVARIAPSMNIPKEGHVENSEGDVGRSEVHHKRAQWCDFSGMVGGGINGICIFDHPENPEYPGFWGEIAVPSQITLLHHPPDELDGSTFHLKFRIYVHDGDTAGADVHSRYQSYTCPIKVELVD